MDEFRFFIVILDLLPGHLSGIAQRPDEKSCQDA
jgi:hypothetical protein